MLVAAAAILLVGSAIAAVATTPPPDPAVVARNEADEQRVLDDLGAQLADVCLTPPEAVALFRERLDALGLADWTIRDDGRAARAPCTGASAAGDTHEVLVMPSMGMRVAVALDELQRHLLSACLSGAEAVDLLRTTLTGLGIADPKVEITGVTQVPLENTDAFLEHVRKGCHVLGGAQFDEVGNYTWYVSGP